MKRLIVFCDGTWNSADQKSSDNRPCPTNVARLFQSTSSLDDKGNPQIVHYIAGVGTRLSERISGGGFGYGISDNVKNGYQFICSNYEEGDEIFLFGFSRGAYTARSIGGLIHNMGILKRPHFHRLNEAYSYYRNKSPDWRPGSEKALAFQNESCWPSKDIHLVGVWDTVGSLGVPYGLLLGKVADAIFKCSFHDTRLSSSIKSAYHAIAEDERRWPFRPNQWELNPKYHTELDNFKEEWFPGTHSDVGGGYPETGLSDVALAWMLDNAAKHGMKAELDKVENPPFAPDPNGVKHDSQSAVYKLATQLFVKIPSKIGIPIPNVTKDMLSRVDWKGHYHRRSHARSS